MHPRAKTTRHRKESLHEMAKANEGKKEKDKMGRETDGNDGATEKRGTKQKLCTCEMDFEASVIFVRINYLQSFERLPTSCIQIQMLVF